jgi:hypothetical protein
VAAELLEVLSQVPPASFESIILDLLHRMGYRASRADLQRVGKAGDGGIDGVISLDRLGLEKVYVQAKRWQSPVGRPEVQGFYGALAGQRAGKGVFITTSTFTPQAVDFARSVEGVVLVDGRRLSELMIDHEVGVTLRPVKVPKLSARVSLTRRRCPRSWSGSSAGTSPVASWLRASGEPGARGVGTTSWWRSPAAPAPCAPRVMPGAWPRPRRT